MPANAKINTVVATSIGLGAIIGAGIFALSGTAIAIAGVNAIWAFLLVGIVAIFVALQSSELVSLMPNAKGATYSYVYNAFGSELGFITGIISFFSNGTSISVIALSFGAYLASLLGYSTAAFSIPFAILLILILGIINILGFKKAASSDYFLVLIKICILVVFVIFAIFFALYSGASTLSHFSLSPSQAGLSPFFAASVVIFFAYGGFQTVTTIVSLIKGGSRSAIRAMLASVIISIVIYLLVILGLLLLLPASQYTVSADPLTFALKTIGAPVWLFLLVGIGALIATASATIARILSTSRLLYQLSTDRLLPSALRKYNRGSQVAVNGVILCCVVGVVMLFAGNVFVIAAISNFGMLFCYLMISLVVIHFRRSGKISEFRSPFYPYLSIASIVILLAFMFGMPSESLLIGVMLILLLFIVYYSLREVEKKKAVRVRLFK
jgi:APA family basic amino acid/polyamine antiporter